MPRKPAPPAQPTVIQTYGCPVQGKDQLFYDRYAFAYRVPVDRGAPTRLTLFRRIADKMLPGHFEWHTWTERMINGLCEEQWIGMAGCSSCVAGHTRLLNPITGEAPTIQELCESGTAPVVMTLEGPTQAEVPYVKGVEQLFEVELENGTRFEATSEHRVLASRGNANRWCHVSDLQTGEFLLAYEPTLQPSTLGLVPSIPAGGAPCFQKRVVGCQGDCSTGSRRCDALPLLFLDTCQSSAPSPVGALGRIRGSLCWGDLGSSHKRTHWTYEPHLSTMGFGYRRNSCDIPASLQLYPETFGHAVSLREYNEQSRSAHTPLYPSGSPVQRFDSRPSFGCEAHLISGDAVSYYGWKVTQSRITRISATRKDVFYDIHVPGPEHYFAEGAIHHNSGKTFNITSFAVLWWLANPTQSSVILTSTTVKAMRRRAWAEITKCYTSIPGPRLGNFVDSRMMWQATKGDDRHAIFGIAVEEGATSKVADNIKGVHTKRQLVVIDEATAVPQAIFEACTNLYSYPEEFLLVVVGNPRSRLDEMGKFCEPLNGWNSVSIETEEWETKPQLNGRNGVVLRFDAEKSPNIVEGRIVSKHMPTKEKVEARKAKVGGENDPSYWSNDRGFWPPEGLTKTVFSESMLNKHDGYGRLAFTGNNFQIIGAFDPAFGGGDRAVLRFAKMGEVAGNKLGIQAFPPIHIPMVASSSNPVHFQIAEQIIRQCETFRFNGIQYSCPPENLAVDATGEGGGLCDIIQRTWSPKIIRVEFGGKSSDDTVSLEDARLASDVYQNKRVEMHFRSRNALMSGQLKGIDQETAIELCSIEFDDTKPKISLMRKADYKLKFGKSPDLGDSLVMLLEVAQRRGFRIAAVGQTVNRHADWQETVKATQSVFESVDYTPQEQEEDFAVL